MSYFLDRCQFTAANGGVVDFVVSSAVTGFHTPAQASAVDGNIYSYAAQTVTAAGVITAWEVGRGAYTSSSTTLARTTIVASSNSGSIVNFSSAPQVLVTQLAEDTHQGHAAFGNTAVELDPTGVSSPLGTSIAPAVLVWEEVEADFAPATSIVQRSAYYAYYGLNHTNSDLSHEGFAEAFYGDAVINEDSVGPFKEVHGILAATNNRGQGDVDELIGGQFIARNESTIGSVNFQPGCQTDVIIGAQGGSASDTDFAAGFITALQIDAGSTLATYAGLYLEGVDCTDAGQTIGDLYGIYITDHSDNSGSGSLTVTGDRYNFYSAGANSQNKCEGVLEAKTGQLTATAFASLPASPVAGMYAYVNNSDTLVWGATIATSGASNGKVLAFYNGTVWTVAGK